MPPLPLNVGGTMTIGELAMHRDWLIEGQRDLEIQDFYDNNLLDSDWRPMVRQARDLLDGYRGRLGIHGPTEGLPLACADRRVQALVTERLRQALEVAAELKASHMVVHSPFDYFGHPQVAHTPGKGLEQVIEQAHAILEPVLAEARAIGCPLVVEVCYDTSTAPLLALVRSFADDALQLSLDTGHAFIMEAAGGPPPDQWVRDGGALLAHLHLQDTDRHLDRHWAPGEGLLNWHALFEALAGLAHEPRLVLEIDARKIRQGADYLAARGFVR